MQVKYLLIINYKQLYIKIILCYTYNLVFIKDEVNVYASEWMHLLIYIKNLILADYLIQ